MRFWKPEIDEIIDVNVDDEQWWELVEDGWISLDSDKPPTNWFEIGLLSAIIGPLIWATIVITKR